MRVLVTGKSGQLGCALHHALGTLGSVIATERSELDLEDIDQIRARIREIAPEVIVNAAAYTDVEGAERAPERAQAINGVAPGVMAEEARRLHALLVHFSTDYVFDGKREGAYREDDPVHPLNMYGTSKAFGEQAVMASGADAIIIRTSWLYAARGKNFLLNVLDRIRKHERLEIVSDQIGAPTYARDVANAVATLLKRPIGKTQGWGSEFSEIYHLTADGHVSWFDFALAIRRLARTLEGVDTMVTGIPSSMRHSVARRPLNSRLSNKKFLDTFGFNLPDWQDGLNRCFQELTTLQVGIGATPSQGGDHQPSNELAERPDHQWSCDQPR